MKTTKVRKICNLCHLSNLHINQTGGAITDPPDLHEDFDISHQNTSNSQVIPVDQITDKTEIFDDHVGDNQDNQSTQKYILADPIDLQFMNPSRVPLYTIPFETILYHGSLHADTFDLQTLNLGTDKSTNVAFFSPNIDISKEYILDCRPPNPTGFIHKFITKLPIDRLFIIDSTETESLWNEKLIQQEFCNSSKHGKLNGIGFFVSHKNTKNAYHAEFALCNPLDFLTYVGTVRCIAPRTVSETFEMFSKV